MSRNGSGVYTSPVNSWNPQINGALATGPDFNAQLVDIANALTQSVSADGQTPITGNINMNGNKLTNLAPGANAGDSLRWQQLFSQGVEIDVASAATVDIGIQNTCFLRITGTTTITSFGTNYNGPRFLRMAGALSVTNSATLICPDGVDILTAAGDILVVMPKATTGTADGWYVARYITAGSIQTQRYVAYQTAGTAPAYTLTPSPAIQAYSIYQRFNVNFNAVGTLGSNTLNVSGLGVKNLKQYDASGVKQSALITSGLISDVIYDGTDFVLVSPLAIPVSKIQSLSASVAGNILTVNYAGGALDFRSPTLTTGAPISVTVPANSIAIPNGATLGTVSTISARLIFLEAYNGGSPVLCVTKQGGGTRLDETNLISPTTISAAATSATVIYSASAVSANSPYRVIGFVDITEATAGTWATAPTQVQGTGGQALASLSSVGFGQVPQVVTRNSSTTYYNTTGQPFMVYRTLAQNSSGASVTSTLSLNGGTAFNFMSTPGGGGGVVTGACMIPADNSYLMSDSNNVPASTVTVEVR